MYVVLINSWSSLICNDSLNPSESLRCSYCQFSFKRQAERQVGRLSNRRIVHVQGYSMTCYISIRILGCGPLVSTTDRPWEKDQCIELVTPKSGIPDYDKLTIKERKHLFFLGQKPDDWSICMLESPRNTPFVQSTPLRDLEQRVITYALAPTFIDSGLVSCSVPFDDQGPVPPTQVPKLHCRWSLVILCLKLHVWSFQSLCFRTLVRFVAVLLLLQFLLF